MMALIKFWFFNARPRALPQSLLPALLAVCLAKDAPGFSIYLACAAVLGVLCAHLSANLFDDYFDYRKCRTDYRDTLKHEGFRARIGKCLYLTSGQATLGQLLAAALVFMGLAFILGSVILYFRGGVILGVMIATAILCISYSGPPLRLSYRGLGELAIGLIFGPMNMLGTYYATCGEMNRTITLISIPIGLLVMNIVYVHSMLDFVPDKKLGKQTLAVLLDRTTAMLAVLFLVLFLPYLVIGYGIFYGHLPRFYGISLFTLPMASALFYMMLTYVRVPDRKFSPKPWMGPMPGWQRFEAMGIDWFMIRWMLARNLLSLLCLIIMALSLLA
ncbi:MAG: prenyltransferase [Azoarcus sp.]|nr:prenyltransferase [Azoarcus sp.]